MVKLTTCLIDTFTSTPFKGNPTAVCHTSEELHRQIMQSIAHELNYPVTAFIKMKEGNMNAYDIRYFSPATEIPTCGHATLASAKFVLQDTKKSDPITFYTTNNTVIKTVAEEDIIMMTYPVYQMENCSVDNQMMDALHLKDYKMAGYSKKLETLFIEVDSPGILKALQPDYQKLIRSNDQIKEVVITSTSDEEDYDYLLRSFCPWIGIDEDPVTGSVHAVLANFWKARSGKNTMNAYQPSLRGGELLIRPFDDKVEIGGNAIIILKGLIDL